MKLSEYIRHLQNLQAITGDVEVVTLSAITSPSSLFVSVPPPGWVRAIVADHPHLKRGYAWREPLNRNDEPEAERVRLVHV